MTVLFSYTLSLFDTTKLRKIFELAKTFLSPRNFMNNRFNSVFDQNHIVHMNDMINNRLFIAHTRLF